MRLTNTMRDAFVLAAMQDVPKIDYHEVIRAETIKAYVEALPAKLRAVYDDPELRLALKARTVWYANGVVVQDVPGVDAGYIDERKELPKLPEKAKQHLKDLEVKMQEQEALHSELKAKIHGVAYSCTTRKALHAALPEFEKYLPSETEASTNLPALANVVAEFAKAGWPKEKQA